MKKLHENAISNLAYIVLQTNPVFVFDVKWVRPPPGRRSLRSAKNLELEPQAGSKTPVNVQNCKMRGIYTVH